MEIIKDWVTLKLGLEIPKPDEFDKGLANGVLIAEILRKYGVLSDDEEISLKHDDTENTRHGNMKHIEKWLIETSGLKINESDLEDIAMEKRGCGMKLLYDLFLHFGFDSRTPKIPGESSTIPNLFDSGTQTKKSDIYEQSKTGPRPFSGIKSEKEIQSITNGQRHTSDDRIEFPRKIVLQKPFLESSESAQAQHLYFCLRSLEILKIQEVERLNFARDRQLRLKSLESRNNDAVYGEESFPPPNYKMDSMSIRNRQRDKRAETNTAKFRNIYDAMDKFDLMAAEADLRCNSDQPIYADGRGDFCEYEVKIRNMRCKRQRKVQGEQNRSLMRKQILNRFTEETPVKMLKGLEREAMSGLARLPASERLLAAFVQRCHLEKQHFLNHTTYEARQLQTAITEDLDKESRIKLQDEEFLNYVNTEKANSHKTFDFVCRVLEEPDLLQRLAMADDTIKDMVQRALKIKPSPPPPPPPCTPTFTYRKHCKEIMHKEFGRILVCEDELLGEDGIAGISYCRVLPQEFPGENGQE